MQLSVNTLVLVHLNDEARRKLTSRRAGCDGKQVLIKGTFTPYTERGIGWYECRLGELFKSLQAESGSLIGVTGMELSQRKDCENF